MPSRLIVALLLFMVVIPLPTSAASTTVRAFDAAIALFEKALPGLGAEMSGVATATYRDALTLRRFRSAHWGDAVDLRITDAASESAGCARFAAYVDLPPRNGTATLTVCPRFHRDGSDALRALTILHEVVHAVAGPDECRAMAFAAAIEQGATGRFTDVGRYWRANSCQASPYALP